jgi:cystathionine beta-lyase
VAILKAGDHVLVTDNVYEPTRILCDGTLSRLGISTTYYDPLIGSGIASLFKPNTRAVYLESPGSLSFEIQDVPAIAAAAHAHGAVVLMDNTWASPLYFQPLEKGVDLAIQSGSKYIGGHSDLMLGTISANRSMWPQLIKTVHAMGLCVGPDDMYLGLRGLRTMGVRLAQHYAAGLSIAHWLEARPEVLRVLHPALERHPGHAIWQRDHTGASGLFSVVFKPTPQAAVFAFVDALSLFGIGASWGGYESLIIPFDCKAVRTATQWAPGGPTVRLHIGLEAVDDLIADLERGFAAMAKAG